MKRIVMLCCMFVFMLAAPVVMAQEKVKVTEDKTKIKDDGLKSKEKDDKTKIKGDNNYKEKIKDDKTKIKDDNMKIKIKGDDGMNMALPYTATYSSNFIVGNPEHSRMILNMWKDWDDNAFDRHDYWADTIAVFLPDGTVMKGKTSALEGAKKYRGGLKSAVSAIHAWVPLRSTDKNEDWVAIWGTETDTWPDGKIETSEIHEIWRINKDGKVDLMRQFTAKPAPQQ